MKPPTPAKQIAQLQRTVKLVAAATLKVARKVARIEKRMKKEASRVITGFADLRGDMVPMEEDESTEDHG